MGKPASLKKSPAPKSVAIQPLSESLLYRVAQCLLAAPVKTAPAEALALLAPRFEADRVWLIRLDEGLQNFWVSYEWCAEGVLPCLPDMPGVPTALIAHPLRSFTKGQIVILDDIEKLPPDAQPLKEEMRREGNFATAGAPIFRDGRLVALIGLDDTRKVHAWTPEEMEELRLLGDLIFTAAERAIEAASAAPADPPPPEPNGCYVRTGNCHVQARWNEIILISADGDHSRVRLEGGREFFELKALSAWEAMLPANRFTRVHRSHIINWSHVRRLLRTSGGRWTLEAAHAPPVPVGRSYQAEVRKHINLRAIS
ncbi:hypothetical protein DB345_13175 [Spartobacteria bacterium LR76]|nr:hypothetical protein DB345_13175 [Spartobacteria bacterium LR76]